MKGSIRIVVGFVIILGTVDSTKLDNMGIILYSILGLVIMCSGINALNKHQRTL